MTNLNYNQPFMLWESNGSSYISGVTGLNFSTFQSPSVPFHTYSSQSFSINYPFYLPTNISPYLFVIQSTSGLTGTINDGDSVNLLTYNPNISPPNQSIYVSPTSSGFYPTGTQFEFHIHCNPTPLSNISLITFGFNANTMNTIGTDNASMTISNGNVLISQYISPSIIAVPMCNNSTMLPPTLNCGKGCLSDSDCQASTLLGTCTSCINGICSSPSTSAKLTTSLFSSSSGHSYIVLGIIIAAAVFLIAALIIIGFMSKKK